MSSPKCSSVDMRYDRLCGVLRPLRRVVVAFSAGVDSTLVLKAALETLGRENVLAATGVSPSLAGRELQSVKELAAILGAELALVDTSEMDSPEYAANPANRCFFCKSELYGKLSAVARERGYEAVANGLNADDRHDHIHGMRAAGMHAVHAPLMEAALGKVDVRELAQMLGLPNWEKPALACLSSRIPYGTPVTITSLGTVEKAEAFLWERGFVNFRVRHHTKLARIEVSVEDLPRLLAEPLRSELLKHFTSLGYTYVTVDLAGFRSGSGNEVLRSAEGHGAGID